jgi:hypothetical protein
MSVRRWTITILVILAVWMGGYAFLTRDPDTVAYREMCVQSAQSALDGLGTARMAADGDLLSPYRTSLDKDAQKQIGGARTQIAGQVPPDERSTARRDTLMPLLDQAETAYADLIRAQADEDEGGQHKALDQIRALEDQLRDFIDGNR